MFEFKPLGNSVATPNRWDWALLPMILGSLLLLAYGSAQMARPYHLGETLAISLDPSYLPYYLLRTSLRMLAALCCSLLFSFAFAAIAARYRTAEKIDLWVLSAPLALMLTFLLALVAALGRNAPGSWLPRRPGRSAAAGLWLAMLTSFIGVPIDPLR